jgi:hypothetical protein
VQQYGISALANQNGVRSGQLISQGWTFLDRVAYKIAQTVKANKQKGKSISNNSPINGGRGIAGASQPSANSAIKAFAGRLQLQQNKWIP